MQIKSVINLALTVGVVISSMNFPNEFLSGPVDRIDRPPSGINNLISGLTNLCPICSFDEPKLEM